MGMGLQNVEMCLKDPTRVCDCWLSDSEVREEAVDNIPGSGGSLTGKKNEEAEQRYVVQVQSLCPRK